MADLYQVLSQKKDMQISPAGTGFETVWDIVYKVLDGPSRGTIATVTVPDSDHNAPYVDGAIREKISALNDIAGLGSAPYASE